MKVKELFNHGVRLKPSKIRTFLGLGVFLGSLALTSYVTADKLMPPIVTTAIQAEERVLNNLRDIVEDPLDLTLEGTSSRWSYDVNDNYLTSETFQQIKDYSVRVTAPGRGNGSGTVIDLGTDEHLVLTCDHVARIDLGKGFFYTPHHFEIENNQYFSIATLIAFDEEHDLALLKLENNFPTPFKGPFSSGADFGDYWLGFGHPQGKRELTITQGKIDEHYGSTYLQISADMNFGESGGGSFVFLKGLPFYVGPIVAVSLNSQGIGYVIAEDHTKNFLIDYKRKHL